jgi:WD40 repeat protein
MCILKNKYLIVSFYLYIILIDIEDEYKLLHEIKTFFGCVNSFCCLNNNNDNNIIFFSGDDIGDIIEWKINNNKIIKIKEYNNSKKEINSIINFKLNSWIATAANDGVVKFDGDHAAKDNRVTAFIQRGDGSIKPWGEIKLQILVAPAGL